MADKIECLSLGRTAFIGELYDARTECFSSQSLLMASFPAESIQRTDTSRMEFEYRITDTMSDRFDLLKVEGELQVAVLLGLVKLDGSARFLAEEAKSEKVVSSSLVCKIQTVNEKLIVCAEDLLPHLDLDALNDPRFTHVVVEISWGANCLLSLEASCKSDCSREDIRGHFAGEFSSLKAVFSGKGQGDFNKMNKALEKVDGVSVKVSADLIPDAEWPTTVEGFIDFLKEVPTLLREVNKGKGKPLSYCLIPLAGLRRLAKLESAVQTEVKRIDESFLSSLVMLFEDVAQLKQKFQDVLTMMKDNQKFVRKETLKEVMEKQTEILAKETELKCLVREEWAPVKSGKKTLKELVRTVEQFKSRNLRLTFYEDFLDSLSSVATKLSTVTSYTSKGVLYLGRGDKFEDVQRQHPNSEFIVMVTSTDMENADPELHSKTSSFFVAHFNDRLPNTVYVVLDLDFGVNSFSNEKLDRVRCISLLKGKILSKDLLADYIAESEMNFARLKNSTELEFCMHKPGNRVVLEMPCPGFQAGTCPSTALKWTCSSCRTNLEYGFDNSFYCSCGKAPATSYEYRCNSPKHGVSTFVSPQKKLLQTVLDHLRPLKEMNILVIGQSGVGKSTWINSIVNYLTYDTLEEAKASGAVVVIPAKFTMYDPKTQEKREIRVGEENANEVLETGWSATQFSCTYTFPWEDRCVRIIDTPGLGDTRGIEQDKENLSNLVQHISNLRDLHGVCILLKANENRMNVLFSYCVKELLAHLHKSVAKNIVFCFTSARNSFYSPGSASTLLEKLLDGLGIKSLALGVNNRFCLDNEAFLFLCALENGMTFDDDLAESFQKSWNISLKETRRLMNTIKNFTPHALEETVSLVNSRSRVLTLTKPLAEVSKLIQLNIQTCMRKKDELNNKELTLKDLSKKLHVTGVKLELINLDKPRTVCTSPKCVTYITMPNSDVKEIEYTTHCHDECYLKDVTPKTVNNPALKDCKAMNSAGNCDGCGCSWANHMHLTYAQKRVQVTLVDEKTEAIMKGELSEKEKLEHLLKAVQDTVENYRGEETFILTATAKFAMFLKKNAITVYNDHIEGYLEHLIREEENKPHKSKAEHELLQKLRDSLAAYREEVRVLTNAIGKGEVSEEVLTPQGVKDLECQLYNLELTGETIKAFVDMDRAKVKATQSYFENPVQLARPAKGTPRYSNGTPYAGPQEIQRQDKKQNLIGKAYNYLFK